MGRQLTLELPDELYEPLTNAAAAVGQSLDEWILVRLRPLAQRPILSEYELKMRLVYKQFISDEDVLAEYQAASDDLGINL